MMGLKFAPMTGAQRDFALVTLPALAALLVCFLPAILRDGDTNWHLAAGAWMIEHRQVLHSDPFSYTFAGQPWITHEWLSEIIMAQVFAWSGWSGVMLMTGACLALVIGLLAWELRRDLGPVAVITMAACAAALISPSTLARPHMLALPILTVWTIAMLRARSAGRAPSLWLTPLMLLWANLHGSYVIGLVIAAVFALEALVEAPKDGRLQVVIGWGVFGGLAGLMSLITPHGLDGVLQPFEIVGMSSLPDIAEWKSVDFSTLGGFEIVLLAALYVGFSKGVVIPPVRLIFLLLLLHMTLQHQRQVLVFGVVAPLLLAQPFARAFGHQEPLAQSPRPRAKAFLIGVSVALVIAVAAARLAIPFPRTDSPSAPVTALAQLPETLKARPMLNDYSFGGWLILNGMKPFIDGRADMYGDAHMQDYLAATRGDMMVFERLRARYGFEWTLLSPRSALARNLDSSPEWRRIYLDRRAVVHVHVPPSP